MSEIHIGELQSTSMTELEASDLKQIVGGTYLSLKGLDLGHISFNFKSLDLEKLLGKEFYDALKKGKKYSYNFSHYYSSHKGINHSYYYSSHS